MPFKAILAFEDGSVFYGKGFGKEMFNVGELVFNTSMCYYKVIYITCKVDWVYILNAPRSFFMADFAILSTVFSLSDSLSLPGSMLTGSCPLKTTLSP